jgi:hypothetical protein
MGERGDMGRRLWRFATTFGAGLSTRSQNEKLVAPPPARIAVPAVAEMMEIRRSMAWGWRSSDPRSSLADRKAREKLWRMPS